MSITVRKSSERGHFDHGWLNTYHTFSFGNYYDPQFMGFRTLRVINEDRVAPQSGFPLHPHKDMEIVSLVLEGSLSHEDSTGIEASMQAGEVQIMSAGTGITHSEYNASPDQPVHFLQIWVVPDKKGYEPRYEQKSFAEGEKETLLVSRDGQSNSLTIHQDVSISYIKLKKGDKFKKSLAALRYGYVQVIAGELSLNEIPLHAGDGAKLENISEISIKASTSCEFLFFDLN